MREQASMVMFPTLYHLERKLRRYEVQQNLWEYWALALNF